MLFCFKQNRRTLLCIAVFCLNHAEGMYIRRVQNKNLPEREDFLVILMIEHCPPDEVGFCSYYSDRRSCFFSIIQLIEHCPPGKVGFCSYHSERMTSDRRYLLVVQPIGRRLIDEVEPVIVKEVGGRRPVHIDFAVRFICEVTKGASDVKPFGEVSFILLF